MAYSVVGIVNMALQRLGAKSRISNITDSDDPNAIKANAVWEYVRDLVIEEIKPKFATLRIALAQNATAPVNTEIYDFAYALPSDYLCLADDKLNDDPIVWPSSVAPYIIETLAANDESLCLMTNYDSTTESYLIHLTYIKRVTNPQRYTASFINALAFRLAAELSFTIAESAGKFEAMMKLYEMARRKAKASDMRQDYLADEKSSKSWETAGR